MRTGSALLSLIMLTAFGCVERVEVLPCLMVDGGPNACPPAGPPIRFSADAPCTAALLAPVMRQALCTCSSLSLDGQLTTNAVDEGGFGVDGNTSAAVGVEGNLVLRGGANIGGALIATGTAGIDTSRRLTVTQTVRSAGPIRTEQADCAGDVFAAGDLSGHLSIAGTLHVPDAASIASEVQAASTLREPVVVDSPCGCSAPPVADLAAFVAARRSHNDDALAGFDPDILRYGEGDTDLTLPGGQFYLTGIQTDSEAELTFHVEGNSALIVDGSVRLGGPLHVRFSPGASLDLIIMGELSMRGDSLGAPGTADRLRIWLASSVFQLFDDARIDAIVYAPDTVVSSGGALRLTGALVCKALAAASDVTIHFERALLNAGAVCGGEAIPPIQ